ncbi:hypothetical protein ET1_06_02030 [Edwardsiella tarda ATCC 15947 = NBRC 105688]|nr:hypothetical protein ET1_06_02030 [Edwardsiella tarda ATCC 15947 = NBRC 105688]
MIGQIGDTELRQRRHHPAPIVGAWLGEQGDMARASHQDDVCDSPGEGGAEALWNQATALPDVHRPRQGGKQAG